MPYLTGHTYDRLSPSSAGGGAVFFDEDTRIEYVSSGDDALGWSVRLPTRLGSDRAALNLVGGYVAATSLDLSSLTLGACTVAVLMRWDGGATWYDGIFGLGHPSSAASGVNLYFKVNGGSINLITYQNAAETVLLAAANPTVGLHALVIAPVSHDFGAGPVAAWAWSLDGSAVAYVAMAAAYAAPTTTAPLYLGRSGDGSNTFHGAFSDFAVWQSTLSGAQIAALSTLPGTATYRLPITSGMGAPWLRAEANRFDPAFSTILPAKVGSRPVALTASGVTKTEY